MRSFLLAALVAAVSSPILFAQFHVSPGFTGSALPVGAGVFVGGIDLLPNGNLALFDGTSVVEMDPCTGAFVHTLFTPPGFVFGSFVTVDPTGTYLLFGESSQQQVWRIPLSGGPAQVVATIQYNYDCVFAGPNLAYVSHADSTWTSTEIVLLDVQQQTTAAIALVGGPSGPLALDGEGSLLYGESGAAGLGQVYSWTAAQLAGAIGHAVLTQSDAQIRITGLGTVADMILDNQGDLLIADSVHGSLEEYDRSGFLRGSVATVAGAGGITYLALVDPGPGGSAVFGAYQPASGGAVAAVYSDWATVTDVNVVRPRRAGLDISPAAPVPVGPFSLDLADGPPLGRAMLCVSSTAMVPEYVAWVYDTPFLFGLDPNTLVIAAPLALDGSGGLSVTGLNSGWAGTVHVQGALFDAGFRPLGTTERLAIAFH